MQSWEEFLESLSKNEGLEDESATGNINWKTPTRPSSHIGALAWTKYDGQKGRRNPLGTLYIHFSSGGFPRVWAYYNVPYRTFRYALREAKSHGKYIYWSFLLGSGYLYSGVPIGED